MVRRGRNKGGGKGGGGRRGSNAVLRRLRGRLDTRKRVKQRLEDERKHVMGMAIERLERMRTDRWEIAYARHMVYGVVRNLREKHGDTISVSEGAVYQFLVKLVLMNSPIPSMQRVAKAAGLPELDPEHQEYDLAKVQELAGDEDRAAFLCSFALACNLLLSKHRRSDAELRKAFADGYLIPHPNEHERSPVVEMEAELELLAKRERPEGGAGETSGAEKRRRLLRGEEIDEEDRWVSICEAARSRAELWLFHILCSTTSTRLQTACHIVLRCGVFPAPSDAPLSLVPDLVKGVPACAMLDAEFVYDVVYLGIWRKTWRAGPRDPICRSLDPLSEDLEKAMGDWLFNGECSCGCQSTLA
jgi:hypothetical protein